MITQAQKDLIRTLALQGCSYRTIANRSGVSLQTAWKWANMKGAPASERSLYRRSSAVPVVCPCGEGVAIPGGVACDACRGGRARSAGPLAQALRQVLVLGVVTQTELARALQLTTRELWLRIVGRAPTSPREAEIARELMAIDRQRWQARRVEDVAWAERAEA